MTTLARKQFSVVDNTGNVQTGAMVEVRLETTGFPLATIYSDRAGATPIGNPFAVDATGFASFCVVGGLYKIRAYVGPSGAPTFEQILREVEIGTMQEVDYDAAPAAARSQRVVTASGTVTVTATDTDDIIIQKTTGAATSVALPASASRTRSVKIVDGKSDAGTNNITISVQTGETLYGVLNGTTTIDGNGGSVELTPRRDGTGWY